MHTPLTLALSDGLTIGLVAAQVIINAVLVVGIFWLGQHVRRAQSIESELKQTASNLIDEKFRGFSDTLRNSIDHLAGEIARVNERLSRGESEFRGLSQADHQLDIKIRQAFDEIKDIIRKECPTRQSVAALFTKVDSIAAQVTQLAAEVNAGRDD